jgi:hypothetical protein
MADIAIVHDCDIERALPISQVGPFRDCWLDEENPDANNNSVTAFAGIGTEGKELGIRRHALLYYDLNHFLPADAAIDSATWYIYVYSGIFHVDHNYQLNREDWANYPWVQAEATWNDYKSGTAWATEGGDFTTPQIDLGAIVGNAWHSFTVTDLVTDAWSNRNGICTFGCMRDDDYIANVGYIEFITVGTWTDFRQHHLRVNYHLHEKTFERVVL